jgi:hypothetical protein
MALQRGDELAVAAAEHLGQPEEEVAVEIEGRRRGSFG